jgi:hypothetical protein
MTNRILNVEIGRESMHAKTTCTGPVDALGGNARYSYLPSTVVVGQKESDSKPQST